MPTVNDHQPSVSPPVFISNAPIGEDLLESKSQNLIAQNIARIIIEDDSCKIIGIDGGWGSGKSNLVQLICNKLGSAKYHSFIYDAWGHQEDLQRRSILEELTEDLAIKHQILQGDWREKLKMLMAKSKETQKKSRPSLSNGIILTALIFIITPFLKIISSEAGGGWKYLWALLPLALLGLVYGFYVKKVYSKLPNTLTCKKRIQLSLVSGLAELFYLYQKQQTEDITYEAISEEEPSVKKFRAWMADISQGLVLADKNLILVFDNMDRLPKKKVQDLWSSIHTFFAENTYPRITVLVPFDRTHVETAFTESPNTPNYGGDFINKTFSVVYRVSPPVLSDWKSFFTINWQKAFGNNFDIEKYDRVTQVYDILAEDITPRRIIAFINEFVSIKHIQPDIPEQYVALFILKKSEILKKPFSEIIDPSYLAGADFIYDDRDELAKNIGALVYQIDAEKAIQVIYTSRLTKSLNNNNISDAQLISKSNEFLDILQSAMLTVSNYDNTIICLDQIEAPIKNQIWEDIYVKVMKQTIEGQSLLEFQKVLLTKVSNKSKYLNKIFADFNTSGNFDAVNCYNSINDLDKIINENKWDLKIFDSLPSFKTSPIDFIAYIKISKSDYTKYRINCDATELDIYLARLVLSVEILSSMDYLPYIIDSYTFPSLIQNIEKTIRVSSGDTSKSNLIELLFQRYKESSPTWPLEETIDISQIDLLLQVTRMEKSFYFDLVAMAFTKLDTYLASFPNTLITLLESATEEQVESIASCMQYYKTYGDILLDVPSFSNHPTYLKVVTKLTTKEYGNSSISIALVLKSFKQITEPGRINADDLISRLNAWSENFKEIQADNVKKIIPDISFFQYAVNIDNNLTKLAIKKLIDYLDGISLDEWKGYLVAPNSYEFKAVILLKDYQLNIHAIDAARYILNGMASQEVTLQDKNNWDIINSKINVSSNTTTFKDIRDQFCDHSVINVNLFKFFADGLFNWGQLDKREMVIRKIFTSDILRDIGCRELIVKYRNQLNIMFAGSDKNDAEDFRKRVQELLINAAEEDSIHVIAEELGIQYQFPDTPSA